MGKGHGQGQGSGEGQGQGQGGGSGGVDDTSVVAGGACSVILTVFMCVCGLPMLFAGIALLTIYKNWDDNIVHE